MEFQPFEKLARLNREIVITEKLDGTNGAVVIMPETPEEFGAIAAGVTPEDPNVIAHLTSGFKIYAQSRNRFITTTDDNYGFARWVNNYAETLVPDLGEGRHFGEWWGSGIQRGYGLTGGDKRFSLFNSGRWEPGQFDTPGLDVVPTLYSGIFSQQEIDLALHGLEAFGSRAATFDKPEGIVIYHTAARVSFKVTIEKDSEPKGGIRLAHDLLPVPA